MNNKKLGTAFEKELCEYLKNNGWWVHFISPDNRGAQPFDIIAVKDGMACAIECKTLADSEHVFTIKRLQENQIYAFRHWNKCGNIDPFIFVKWRNKVAVIQYDDLLKHQRVRVEEHISIEDWDESISKK